MRLFRVMDVLASVKIARLSSLEIEYLFDQISEPLSIAAIPANMIGRLIAKAKGSHGL
jgi:uncharacterized integral membrane protein